MKHIIIQVYGKVQGVGYRYSARHEAEKLNIQATAENKPDGSVYIEAHGDEANIHQFLAWCAKGPWLAKVTKVEPKWMNEEYTT